MRLVYLHLRKTFEVKLPSLDVGKLIHVSMKGNNLGISVYVLTITKPLLQVITRLLWEAPLLQPDEKV